MRDICYDELTRAQTKDLHRKYEPRHDGNYWHREFSGWHLCFRHGGWKTFGAHGVETGTIEMLGQTGLGCMPGHVKTIAKIIHIGPLKLRFGWPRKR